MSFETEQTFYESQKDALLKHHADQFVLIKGQKIYGYFGSEQEAFEKGVELFGAEDMFIKQILKEEPKHFIPAFSTNPHAGL